MSAAQSKSLKAFYSSREAFQIEAYSGSEVAHLTGTSRQTVRNWARRYLRPEAAAGFSFEDLIEIHVLTALHRTFRALASDAVLARIKQHSPAGRPLLHRGIIGDITGELISYRKGESREADASAFSLLDAWLDRVEWVGAGEPVRLYPLYRSGIRAVAEVIRQAPRRIFIDPRIGFGRPLVAESGVPVDALVGRYRAGDSLREVADDYRVAIADVEECLRYELITAS